MIPSFIGKYSFLSNFYPSPVELDGIIYPTVENAYQAGKTVIPAARLQFINCSPGKAKRLGRIIDLRSDWESIKLQHMEMLIAQKFNINSDLSVLLVGTCPHELIEGNSWGDTFWGMYNGAGENNLGKILMRRRDCLIERWSKP